MHASFVRPLVFAVGFAAACGPATPPVSISPLVAPPRVDSIDARCTLPAPTVLVQDGATIFYTWDLPSDGVWLDPVLPDDAKYLAYRDAIRAAGADLARPIADEQTATTDEQRELWRRERLNAELAFPTVRRAHCLEAALFAIQHSRFDQLSNPTEFVATILRKDRTLRVYFGASGEMFPPKSVYGLDEARRDVVAGWKLLAHLHNHTIVKRAGKPALGTPSPSTSDVQLLRGVAEELKLEAAWVTNGMYTAVVPGSALSRYHTR